MIAIPASEQRYFRFGEFTLDSHEGLLTNGCEATRLAPKTCEVLLVLMTRSGELVSKSDLLDIVWNDSVVEEGNLTVHIAQLRKLLGDDVRSPQYLETVPKKGYKFKIHPEIVDPVTGNGGSLNGLTSGLQPGAAGREHTGVRTTKVTSGMWRKIPVVGLFVGVIFIALAAFAIYKRSDSLSGFKNMTAERITNQGTIVDVHISPDGKFVVYSDYEKSGYSMWLKSIETRSTLQIHPPTMAGYYGATITPDGQSIIYGAYYEGMPSGAYIMPLFGGNPAKLQLPERPLRPAISPDGNRLAYINSDRSQGQTHLAVALADGTDSRNVATRQSPDSYWIQPPSWSPDGKKIAVVAQNADESALRLVVVEVETGTETIISKQNWKAIVSSAWLPDMTGLLMTATEETSGSQHIWHISYPDGQATRLTNTTVNYSFFSLSSDATRLAAIEAKWTSSLWTVPVLTDRDGPAINLADAVRISSNQADGYDPVEIYSPLAWTPDGRIIFNSEESGNTDIWSIYADGSNRTQITKDRMSNAAPSVSPNGKSIAFMSNLTGKSSLWIMDLDGGNQRRLTNNLIEKSPAFSPDGNWLYFTAWDSGQANVWRIPVNGGEALKAVNETSSRPSVSPDGRWLLYERPTGLGMQDLTDGSIRHFDTVGHGPQWLPNSNAFSFLQYEGGLTLWLQPLDGDRPILLAKFDSDQIVSYGWSRDGKLLAFARHSRMRDVTVLSVPKR